MKNGELESEENIVTIPDNDANVKEKSEKPVIDIFEILKLMSPGTQLRIALDDILRAELGALIVVMNENVSSLLEGGFKVNCKFTPQRLTELAKMDGAVVLSEDLRKILYANVLLVPDAGISTSETGTRHKAAERVAKQTSTLTIAVSERRKKITLYYDEMRYVLKNTEEILRRATETLQILEKQREIYDELLMNLNVLEVTNLVSVSDVCNILQRTEMIGRISENIRRSIVELGRDGSIIKMRLRELTRNIEKTEQFIVKDYASKIERVRQIISEISFDDLLDTENMSKLLFNRGSEEPIQARGYRLLSRTGLGEGDVQKLTDSFKDLNSVLNSDAEEIMRILGQQVDSKKFIKDLNTLKENIMVGKKI